MTLTAYAIGEERQQLDEELTLEGVRLRTIAAGGLAIFVAERPPAGAGADEEALWHYERVVERLMARQTILPTRYGTVLADEGAARAALDERREELTRRLREVRDAVELAVRATWSHERRSSATPGSGREYMLGRLQAQHEAQRIAELLEPLRSLARRSVVRLLPRPTVPFMGAYLVDRDRMASFNARLHSLRTGVQGAVVSCTGPWPPYSFAEGGES